GCGSHWAIGAQRPGPFEQKSRGLERGTPAAAQHWPHSDEEDWFLTTTRSIGQQQSSEASTEERRGETKHVVATSRQSRISVFSTGPAFQGPPGRVSSVRLQNSAFRHSPLLWVCLAGLVCGETCAPASEAPGTRRMAERLQQIIQRVGPERNP